MHTLRHWLGAAAIGAIAANAAAQSEPAEAPARDFAVRCGTLLIGDGSAPLRDTWLVVKGGKVHAVGVAAPPADLPVVDAGARVVMPGIVAVDSDLHTADDSDYQVSPDALAVDGFDFERKHLEALQGGVTTAYVSPGRNRLVSGQGAVIKLAGRDLVERVLTENACLRVNFGDSATQAPRVFEPIAHPTAEEPLEPSRIQTPTARISVLAELRALFAAATDPDRSPGGHGAVEQRYDEQPLADVVGGKLPLRAAATRGHDIRRALQLQQELGVRMVLEDPQEIEAVAAKVAAQDVAATFRVPIRFGMANPGGEDRRQKEPLEHPEAPARAAAAGVRIGLAPATGISPRDYLMAVAIAVGHGLSRESALRAIAADAARILGVDGRVGTLAPGKDADFVVLSGDPLAVGTMVEATWVDGRRAWARPTQSRHLAVRVGRILDGTGRVYRNGVVLVQDGRIKGVGEELTIPYGAEIVDLPAGVMTPGFVDAFSHLGLAGYGTGVPNGTAGQRLGDSIEHDDTMFAPALAEGLTTLLVSGKDAGPQNGRICAIKTGAQDRDGLVLREVAGWRLAHDAIGPGAIKPLADQIERGKRYVEQWQKYEQALAEWQRGGPTAKAPEPAPAPAPADGTAPPEDPVSGVWEADIDLQGQVQIKVVLELKLAGTTVTGTIKVSFAGREMREQEITSGSWTGGKLKLEFRGMGGTATLEATLQGDTLNGTFSMGRMGEQEVTGKRTSKSSGAPAKKAAGKTSDPDGKPKAPKVDENLEPMRAVLEKRGALVVRVDRAAAIRDVIELLEKEQVAYVLQGVDDLLDDPTVTQGKKPAILVGPDTVGEEDGAIRNEAALLCDRDLPILFGSGDCAGARFLPVHAAYAVRYGLGPMDALAALTLWPARAFQLADRIGSLEKGKDADLVVFSGDPFEPQSRVLLVVCNGNVVVDHREQAR